MLHIFGTAELNMVLVIEYNIYYLLQPRRQEICLDVLVTFHLKVQLVIENQLQLTAV